MLGLFIVYQPPRLPPPPEEPPRLPPPIEPPLLLPPDRTVPPLDLEDELLRVVVVGRELRDVLLILELPLVVLLPLVIFPFLLLMVFRVDILVFEERLRLFCSTVLLKFELAGNALLERLPIAELLRLELLLKVLFLP